MFSFEKIQLIEKIARVEALAIRLGEYIAPINIEVLVMNDDVVVKVYHYTLSEVEVLDCLEGMEPKKPAKKQRLTDRPNPVSWDEPDNNEPKYEVLYSGADWKIEC